MNKITTAKTLISKAIDVVTRKVTLCGTKSIMFARYPGDNDTKLEPEQKLYLSPDGRKVIGLPATNIMSFLSAHNTNSAPKRLRDPRKFKAICNACLSFVEIGPEFIPFLRDGKPIVFGQLVDDPDALGIGKRDPSSGVWVHAGVARLDKGIPNPLKRPVLPLPWSLVMDFTLYPNSEIKEQEIINLFVEAGRAIGLGTFRGSFGKFQVEDWS